MADRTIRTRLQLEIADYLTGLKTASRATTEFARNVTGSGQAVRADVEKVGRSALLMAGGLGIALGLSAKAAIDWESAWAGVTKTVEGTEAQLEGLEDGLREMATSLPATHQEIAAVAEAAGALGVATPFVEDFTRTMIDLGETTDLTADQAANAFARIANILQTPQTDFDRMGSTVVDLGNNLAATESEITEMALRIAGAGRQIRLSESDVLGFAGALSSVGIEAEAGGSAISRVFIKIDQAVREGGETLDVFASTAGLSAEEFRRAYQDDAAGAIITFIEGLGRMSDAGGNVFGVLDSLELSEIRVRDALLRAAGAGDLFREAIELGSDAWEENTALADEAAKRYETTAARLEVLRNQVVDVAIDAGDKLLPFLEKGADFAGNLVTGLGELPGPLQTVGVGLGGLSAGLLGVVGMLGTFGPKVAAAREALMGMGSAGQFVGNNLGRITGVLAAAGIALTVYATIVGNQAKKQAEAEEAVRGLTDAMREQGGVVGEISTQEIGSALLEGGLGESLRELEVDLGALTDGVYEHGSALNDLDNEYERIIRAQGITGEGDAQAAARLEVLADVLADAGLAGSALADELLRLAETGRLSQDELTGLLDRVGDQGVAAEGAATEFANLGAAERNAGDDARDAQGPVGDLTGELGEQEGTTVDLNEALKEYADRLAGIFDPLTNMANAVNNVREAQIDYNAAVIDVADAQTALTDAVNEFGRNSPEAEAAARDLVDAQLALDDAQRDVIDSALEMDVAIEEMAGALRQNPALLQASIDKLDEWVAQGYITEDQAAAARDRFAELAWQAASVPDSVAVTATADISRAQARLNDLTRQLTALATTGVIVQPPPGAFARLAHGGYIGGPRGAGDIVPAMLSPGEFVLNAGAVDRVGRDFLESINSGRFDAGPGFSDAGIIDAIMGLANIGGGTTVNVHDRSGNPTRTARAVGMELRKLAMARGG